MHASHQQKEKHVRHIIDSMVMKETMAYKEGIDLGLAVLPGQPSLEHL
jgi:hypothetical protein